MEKEKHIDFNEDLGMLNGCDAYTTKTWIEASKAIPELLAKPFKKGVKVRTPYGEEVILEKNPHYYNLFRGEDENGLRIGINGDVYKCGEVVLWSEKLGYAEIIGKDIEK